MLRVRLLLCLLAIIVIVLLNGCAYGGGPAGPEVVIDFFVRLAGNVNDSFYYFIPIDADGDFGFDGPVPVAAGPFWGNGWGTGSITHYLEYHQGQYNVYRVNSQVRLATAGGGITAVTGVPNTPGVGTSVLTVQTINFGAVTVGGAGMITGATNTGLQAAGTLQLQTNAAGNIVAGSVTFTPSATGGRALTVAEQAVLAGLNAGGVPLATNSLAGLGLSLTLGAPQAGTQTLTVAPTTATVTNEFTATVTGQVTNTNGTLQANTVNSNADSPIPGTSITVTDFVAGGSATVEVELSPTPTLLGPPFEYTLPQGGNALRATIDLATLGDNIPDLSVNIITTTQLIFDPTITDPNLHTYDGLGRLGNRYVTFRTNQFQTINNDSGLFEQELANDTTLIGPNTQNEMNSVDLIDWSITIRNLQ